MTIKASTEYTKESLIKLAKYSSARSTSQIVTYTVLEIIMLAMSLMLILTSESTAELLISLLIITPVLLLVCPLIVRFLPVFLIKTGKAQGMEQIGCVNNFALTEEEILVDSKSTLGRGNSRLNYSALESVHETEEAFYLYISKQQAYILNKSDITEGTVSELQSLLKEKVPKYVVRKRNTKLLPVFVAVVAVAVAATTVYACLNPNSTEKVFSKSGLSITLTEDFREEDYLSFTATYESKNVLVIALKEEYVLFEDKISLEEYAQLVIDVNQIDADVKKTDGLINFSYIAQANGKNYKYFAVVYEGSDAFWMVQFACENEKYDELESTILQYAKSVVVD